MQKRTLGNSGLRQLRPERIGLEDCHLLATRPACQTRRFAHDRNHLRRPLDHYDPLHLGFERHGIGVHPHPKPRHDHDTPRLVNMEGMALLLHQAGRHPGRPALMEDVAAGLEGEARDIAFDGTGPIAAHTPCTDGGIPIDRERKQPEAIARHHRMVAIRMRTQKKACRHPSARPVRHLGRVAGRQDQTGPLRAELLHHARRARLVAHDSRLCPPRLSCAPLSQLWRRSLAAIRVVSVE